MQQNTLREQHGARRERPLRSYAAALENRLAIDWATQRLPVPESDGRRVLDDVPLRDLVPYIDWTFFFAAWELKGRFPAILDHRSTGPAARELYDNARALLDRIVAERLVHASGVYGFWPAASEGDDILLFADEGRSRELTRFNMLRQQESTADGKPNLSLADFVAPRRSGAADYLGAFAVTAGIGADTLVRQFEQSLDDYSAILVKALADRLAEAFAASPRPGPGGDEIDDAATPADVIAERHRGSVPAFGYPACPDHSEKFKLFELLDAGAVGMALTEHATMTPAASVSGLYFGHPQARYFTVGRIGEDQIADYARRKGLSIEAVERWLTPSLGYGPVRC